MNYKNIASILNSQIVQNALGVSVTIGEDLSNIVDLGTLVANMTADAVKDFQKVLVVGVHNYVIEREYNAGNFALIKDAVQYAGGLQRIMATGLFTAKDSHLLNLVNGQSYLDGKFYGMDISAKVYTDTKAFKVVHSVSEDDFRMMFMNASELLKFMGLIAVTEANTIRIELAQLEKRVLNMVAVEAYKDNRKVNLVTEFNAKLGLSGESFVNYADICADRKLLSYFNDFTKECINRVKAGMKEPNKKYNDGTVVTFVPDSDIHTVLISEFAQDIKYLGNPVTLNTAPTPEYREVTAWQNITGDMLPDMTKASAIKMVTGGTEETPTYTTYQNIVGLVYDVECAGITVKANKVTVEEVGSEGFRNLHHHLANEYYVDTRLGAVVFCLA